MEGLEVIAGSMFSGKSTELMRRATRAKIAKQKVLVLKPSIDVRYSDDSVATHDGATIPSQMVTTADDVLTAVEKADPDVVCFDEAQFFSPTVTKVIEDLAEEPYNLRVIAAGLDLDFQGVPFESMVYLLLRADNRTHLRAICVSCGADACRTQRVVDGSPVTDGDVVLVGGDESYEARCRKCFVS